MIFATKFRLCTSFLFINEFYNVFDYFFNWIFSFTKRIVHEFDFISFHLKTLLATQISELRRSCPSLIEFLDETLAIHCSRKRYFLFKQEKATVVLKIIFQCLAFLFFLRIIYWKCGFAKIFSLTH